MRKNKKMNDWWKEHVVIVTTSGDKKLEKQINKTLEEKAIKHFTEKPIKERKGK